MQDLLTSLNFTKLATWVKSSTKKTIFYTLLKTVSHYHFSHCLFTNLDDSMYETESETAGKCQLSSVTIYLQQV